GQEMNQKGRGALRLIFPTRKTRGGGNFVRPGFLVGLPDAGAGRKSWVAERKEPDYAGETLTILLLRGQMAGLDSLAAASDGQPVIEGALAGAVDELREKWAARTSKTFSSAEGAVETVGESNARAGGRNLGLFDALPRTGYKAHGGFSSPLVATAPIMIAARH